MKTEYTVIEVAEMLKVTKQCIYSKLNTLSEKLGENIIIKDNIRYLNQKAIEIIKNSIKDSTRVNKGKKKNELTLTIELLKKELENKENQLIVKDEQLKVKDKLIENMQVLLKKEQENTLMLNENLNKNMLLLGDDRAKSKKSIWNFWKRN